MIQVSNAYDINYGKVFRRLALGENNTEDLSEYEKELFLNNGEIMLTEPFPVFDKEQFANIFFDDDSAKILWILKCEKSEENKLYKFCDYLKSVSSAKRGGLNVYKRMGWDVHVLYAYQLVNENFAKCLSLDIPGAPTDFSLYHNIYKTLSNEAKYILKIATFLHDVGVVDGVSDHEIKGVKWVEQRYSELGISDSKLKQNNIVITNREIIELLKIIVGSHQIMNQIGSEISDYFVFQTLTKARTQLREFSKATEIFENYFAEIMLLLSAADLLAVNDTLLTQDKMNETLESYNYFKLLLRHEFVVRNTQKYGIQRYRSLLPDEKKTTFTDEVFFAIVDSIGYNAEEITAFLYNIKQLSYGMTVVKPQKDLSIGIKLFCIINEVVKKLNMSTINTSIKFYPDIDHIKVGHLLTNICYITDGVDFFDYRREGDNIFINVK